MFANCERAAEGGKLSRVRPSQPLGSVMTGKREPEGKRSERSEVKDVRPESEPQPRERQILGVSRSCLAGRRPGGWCGTDKHQPSPRGLSQHRAAQRYASNQASDEQGLLGTAVEAPEYDRRCSKRRSNGRVASDGDRYTAMVSEEAGQCPPSEGLHGWSSAEEET